MKRGGLCFVGSMRHVTANNLYGDYFNPKKQIDWIMYWDANNLYAWAMSQFLPYADLMFDKFISLDEVLETTDNDGTGYCRM